MKIFFYSQFGKYLPGKIWMIMGKVYLADKYGISKKKVLLSSFIEILASILSGLLLFLISLHFEENFKISPKLLGITLFSIPILLILLNPKVSGYFVNMGLKLFNQEALKIDFTFTQIIAIFFYYLFAWLIIGIGFYMLIGSFVDISYTKIPILAGSLSLAGTIGIISFFVPGGIGVREGILAFLLSNILSAPMAVLSALACRAWLIAGEVVLLAVAYKLRPPIKYINKTINQ
ncbi:MAG: flippase-like domain-containing protein [Bacteroidetes bacterium]|nr:flippase-like domain-containing protein [Bacteroidota bacterium]